MGGEYCTCPSQPCPICYPNCSKEVAMDYFMEEINNTKEQEIKEAIEQYHAEEDVMRDLSEADIDDHDPRHCFCTKHW